MEPGRVVLTNRARRCSAIAATAICLMLLDTVAGADGAANAADPPGPKFEKIDLTKFDRSTTIDNKWLPMKPGTRWTYQGATEEDGKVVPHRIEMNITQLTKIISGVRTLVSYDVDYSRGEVVEAELAFFAQDSAGNVWQFGEYPEEYEHGRFIKAPAWIHGLEKARAGIMMKAEPKLADGYSQGWGPAVGWTDRGTAFQMGQKTSVPAGDYDDVLVIKEAARSEVDATQLKYYAPGVGNIRVGWTGKGKKTRETLELVKIEQLDPEALAEIDAKALQLEENAYKRSKRVYAFTRPIEPLRPAAPPAAR